MEKAELVVLTAAATKKAGFSSVLFSSMVIFNDPAYLIIASIGGFVSMAMAYYDFVTLKDKIESEGKKCIKKMHLELGRAFMIGLLLSLLSFTLMLSSGENVIKYFFKNDLVIQALPSVWMMFTLLVAINADTIYLRTRRFMGGKQ